MEQVTTVIRNLHALPQEPTAEQVAAALGEMPSEYYPEVIEYLDKELAAEKKRKPGRSPEEDAKVYKDAAEHERQLGNLTEHMADWYDNEVRASYHGGQTGPSVMEIAARIRKLSKIKDHIKSMIT